jgi:hypothetical protein
MNRRAQRVWRTLACIVAAVLPAGCGSAGPFPDAKDGAVHIAGPPLPSGIDAGQPVRSASYTEDALRKPGAAFMPAGALWGKVQADGGGASFDPAFTTGSPVSDAAFCVYEFMIPGYDRDPSIRCK